MPVYINDIATAVPPTFKNQADIRNIMKSQVADSRKTEMIIHQMYAYSGIKKRHIAHAEDYDSNQKSFFHRTFDKDDIPTTRERNDIYRTESTRLFVEVAKKLLTNNPGFDKHSITHIITVSCTGFFAPGPEFEIIKQLGLKPSTEGYHIGFMGCYAMFSALKLAKTICEAKPEAVILALSCELCTLHLQASTELDDIVAASVFGDGAAGVIVSTNAPDGTGFELTNFSTSVVYEGEKDMVWSIGDTGFDISLSRYVPDIIESNLGKILIPLFKSLTITPDDLHTWAVHPGGRLILDKIEQSMNLRPEQITPSRDVLANFGNMSSATILFVLDELRKGDIPNKANVLSMAFGPGLTVETGLLNFIRS